MKISYVYWIFDDTCKDTAFDGYVGVSTNPINRLKNHIKNNRVPSHSNIHIIFEGNRNECFELEKTLRPNKGIGWNRAVGGAHGWRDGFEHSPKTKQKLKDAWTTERKNKASEFKKIENKKLIGQKRPAQTLAMMGDKNPMFGTKRPAYVCEAISKAHKGKVPVNKQEIFCVGCHERGSYKAILKYHNKCFKNYGKEYDAKYQNRY